MHIAPTQAHLDLIDELTAAWHNSDADDMSLHSWLGLSWDEYAPLANPNTPLPLRWHLFPPTPRHGWATTSSELSPHRWDEVIAGLWVGGYDCDRYGPELDAFDLVVTADSSVGHVDGTAGQELCCFYDDDLAPSLGGLDEAITTTTATWRAGGRVLIRCAYGQNRGPYLTAHVLHRLGWPTAHAVHRLREVRGQGVLANHHFAGQLRSLAGAREDT